MPRRPSKSPSRARARTRSKSASRSRSKSAGRKTKQIVSDVIVSQEKQVEKARKKSPARRKSKSPSRTASVKETVITKRTIVSSSSGQVQASVTPVRSSSRISMLIEKEKEMAARVRNELKSEILSNITTPPKTNSTEIAEKPEKKTAQYEFMGPIGAFFLILMLPFTVYYVNLSCRKGKCSVLEIPKLPKIMALFEVEAALIFVAWFAFQVLLSVIPVGRVVEGQPLKYGGRLKYRCNGFFALVVSLAALGAAVYLKCPVTKVVDKFFKLMTTSVLFSFLLSIFLYISSKVVQPKKLAPGGNTGNVIYDFFIGRELNPRIGPLDLKFFCELRPGLIGWVMLDWIMVVKAYQDTGTFPQNLLLVTVFQTLYVADALWYEDAILTTMDIIHDGFGFMLAFGDLTWVPFLYCLQPRFLLETGFNLPWYCLAPIVLLNFLGYAIFRLSNSQKNDFRQNPKGPAVADIETLSTNTGKKLLVGGWWGMCRKPNYMGDLFMAFSWSLTTGVGHIFPYFYPVYFLVLLVHRERRDNEQCQKKYGASWDQYCERVKYRIFPYIY